MVKTLTVLTESQFNKAKIDSLFIKHNNGTLELEKMPYCTGHYNKSIIGSELSASDDTRAIVACRRNNKEFGTYYRLRFSK